METSFSIRTLGNAALATSRRFPFEIATAVTGTILAVVSSHYDGPVPPLIETALLACIAMLSLHVAVSVARESGSTSGPVALLLHGVVLVIGTAITLFVDRHSEAAPVQIASLLIATHAAVAVAPFRSGALACWNFNRSLFLRTALAGVFTGVLSGGLLLAMGAIHVLFDVEIRDSYYMDVPIVIVGLFNTLFILSGILTREERESNDVEVPTALRWFVQFVLIPLVGVFLVILYVYGFDVLFFRELDGAVSAYILTLGVAGLLAWVLGWPLRSDANHPAVAFYVRWLGVALIPVTVMLIVAISVRIIEYGITPPRFAVATLTAFLVTVVITLSASRKADLRIIPLALMALAAVTSFGPLSSASVTIRDQEHRFESFLLEHRVIQSADAAIDTLAFQRLPDSLRQTAYEHLGVISGIDTAAAYRILRSHGIDVDRADLKGGVVTALASAATGHSWQTATRESTRRSRLTTTTLSVPLTGGEGVSLNGTANVAMLNSTDGAISIGRYTLHQSGEIGVLLIVDDLSGTAAMDTIDLRHQLNVLKRRENMESGLRHRTVTSVKGAMSVVLLEGNARFDLDRLASFRIRSMVVAKDEQ